MLAVLAFLVGLLGPLPLAAHGIAWQWVALSYMIFIGIAQAGTVRIALAAGAGDAMAVRRAGLAASLLGLIATAICAVAFIAFGREMAWLFLDPADRETPAVISLAASFLLVGALFQFGDAAQAIAMGLLRGLKDTRLPMLIALVGYWLLGLPAGLLLGFSFGLGGLGIWGGAAVGLTSVGIGCLWRFDRLTRQP